MDVLVFDGLQDVGTLGGYTYKDIGGRAKQDARADKMNKESVLKDNQTKKGA